jgi:hypothetical protein
LLKYSVLISFLTNDLSSDPHIHILFSPGLMVVIYGKNEIVVPICMSHKSTRLSGRMLGEYTEIAGDVIAVHFRGS